MRLSTSKKELRNALQKLSRATPARSTLPILSCVLFKADEGDTVLRSTDLEITYVTKIPASIEEAGEAAIPLQTLLDITNELPEGRLTISVDAQYKVELISDTGIYDLMGKPPEEYPSIPDIADGKAITIFSDHLRQIIDKTLFAVSKDELKPSLTGVYFKFNDNDLTAVATDGHRLVRYILKNVNSQEFNSNVIVPRKFLALILTLLKDGEEIQLWLCDNHLNLALENDVIYTRIIDERFPDYENVIPKDNDKSLTIGRDDILSAVKRVSIFSNKSTNQIALRLSADKLLLTTEDPEKASKAQEELTGNYRGEDLTIGYNAVYLKDILSHVEDENLVIQLKTSISAALFYPDSPKEDNDITMLLMPIRLNE